MRNFVDRGFTLLEILVVLIITSFIVAILLQSLNQVFRLQTHFGYEIFHTQNGAMYADWFRQSINSLMPDQNDGKYRFRGEKLRISGLTLAPLDQEAGTPRPFVWRLEFDARTGSTSLYYGDTGDKGELKILAWRGAAGRFTYIDAQDEAHDNWPPFLGKWPQLPSAVFLRAGSEEQIRLIVAVPKGATVAPLQRKIFESM